MSTKQTSLVPCDTDAEADALGCILFTPSLMTRVMDLLKPSDFYREMHSVIYEAMLTVYQRGRVPNHLNVADELRKRGRLDDLGGIHLLSSLSERYGTISHIEDHVAIIKRKALMRHLMAFAGEVAEMAHREEDGVLEVAEQRLYQIALGADTTLVPTLAEVGDAYIRDLERRRDNFRNGVANGVPTNFTDLDKMLGGLQPSELTVLAARPSLGKTSLALNIAFNVVSHTRHTLFFSLEMKSSHLYQRILGMEVPMDQTFLRAGDVTDEEMQQVKATHMRMRDYDLKIDDKTRTMSGVKSKARRIHGLKPLNLIVIDYLGLLQPEQDMGKYVNRVEVIDRFTRELKELAMELDVPILLLAQLNRAVEGRQGPRPQLSDLRESGGVEQNADTVAFLYCTAEDLLRRERCLHYDVVVYVAKQRQGRVGEVSLTFRPRSTKFVDQEPLPPLEVE